MDLAIVNASKLVKDSEAWAIAMAIQKQLQRDVLPDWGRTSARCLFIPSTDIYVPSGVLPLYLYDDPDIASVLGYHFEQAGAISGKVFVKPVLDAGGGILDGGKIGDSVSAVASHEAIEAKFDPNVNLWADGPMVVGAQRFASVSFELCDPVQAGAYLVDGVLVSDYVLRAWFDPQNAKGPFNKLGTLRAPFTVDAGGYVIGRNAPGSEASAFGEAGNLRPWRARTRSLLRLPSAAPQLPTA